MRAGNGADDVEGVADVRDPVAHRLVHRVLERAAAGLDGMDRRAEEPHAHDVQRLALDVLAAHVDLAAQAEERRHGRRRDAVLSGAGLGDDARLPHAARDQDLPERIVDLVRAGVTEVLALQPNARAAEGAVEALGVVEQRRPPRVLALQITQLAPKPRVAAQAVVGALEIGERRHERLAHVAAAVRAEVSARVRQPWHGSRMRAGACGSSVPAGLRRRCTRRRRAAAARARRPRRSRA